MASFEPIDVIHTPYTEPKADADPAGTAAEAPSRRPHDTSPRVALDERTYDTRRMRPHDISEELKPGESLLQRADRLQREAHDVLDHLKLIPFLAAHGHPRIVGSAALGLMTWCDIDIDVEVFDEIRESEVWEVARHLLRQERIALVSVADDRSGLTACRVPSMYVGARYRSDGSIVWKIDIRFVRSADAVASAHLEDLGTKLNSRARQLILEIKNAVSDHPGYGTTLSGLDVYRAVLSDGVEDLAGFESWLERRGPDGAQGLASTQRAS